MTDHEVTEFMTVVGGSGIILVDEIIRKAFGDILFLCNGHAALANKEGCI